VGANGCKCAVRSTVELEIINFWSVTHPLRTLLNFRDRMPSALTVGIESDIEIPLHYRRGTSTHINFFRAYRVHYKNMLPMFEKALLNLRYSADGTVFVRSSLWCTKYLYSAQKVYAPNYLHVICVTT
jgi:hypothetical protein